MNAFALDIADIDELATQVAIKGSLTDFDNPSDPLFEMVVAIVYNAA